MRTTLDRTLRNRLRRIATLASVAALLATGAVSGATRSASASRPGASSPPAPSAASTAERLDALPTAFEPNVGQTDARVSFLARGRGYGVFVTPESVTLALGGGARREAVRMSFAGAREDARVVAEGRLRGVVNFLVGTDRSKWRGDVPTYASVRYSNVYDGVDARLYGTQGSLEYDLEVAPGADPGRIRVRFEGQTAVSANEDGSLSLKLASGEIVQRRAVVYQGGGASKRAISARCVVRGSDEVGFEVGEYDRTAPLVIDPVLVYSDFLGGSASSDSAAAVAADAAGHAYVAGTTSTYDFPVTPGAYDTTYNGTGSNIGDVADVVVTELDASGASAIYATYLGGSSLDDARGIAVDASGAAYVVGATRSPDFPVTAGAFDPNPDPAFEGTDGFVTKIAPGGGSLAYSSYLGGSAVDEPAGVAVDASGRATVVGTTLSSDFPTTAGAYDRTYNGGGTPVTGDGFVTRVAAAGTSLSYSTFFGGTGGDSCTAVAVDGNGEAFVTGFTDSATNFPTTPGAYDRTFGGQTDGFAAEFGPTGASLTYSTFVGAEFSDTANAIAVDGVGAAYVAGHTSSPSFPVTPGAYTTPSGGTDCFVTKIAVGGGSLVYSSRFGGVADGAVDVALGPSGAAYVTGTAFSSFPTTPGAFDTTYEFGGVDAFVLELNPAGSAPVYSTYLGGGWNDTAAAVAVSGGSAYVVGATLSPNFPTTPGAFSTHFGGSSGFVTKLAPDGGSLAYSTFLAGRSTRLGGATDAANAVAVDAAGDAYVAGRTSSPSFPTTPGAYDPTPHLPPTPDSGTGGDAFVTEIAADGSGLVYSTYFGGGDTDEAFAIAVTATGEAVVGGGTNSSDFPVTAGAFDATFANGAGAVPSYAEGFVARLAAGGGSLVSSTFVGGGKTEQVNALALGPNGDVFATGQTSSPDFPTSPGAFDATYGGNEFFEGDAFAVEIAPSGARAYATYLGGGGMDDGRGIAADASGAAYVAGGTRSPNFPTTPGAYDTTPGADVTQETDAFVTKIAPGGGSLAYSTYLGGDGLEDAYAVAVDASGAAYVTGETEFSNFPTTPGAFATTTFQQSVFVTKLAPSGASLVYSSVFGGHDDDEATSIALGASGEAIVTGRTFSYDYPTTPGAYDTTLGASGFFNYDAFLTELDASGSALVYSTFLGGEGDERGLAVATDGDGRAVVVGTTDSTDAFETGFGDRDSENAFVVKLDLVAANGDTPAIYVPATGAWFLKNANASGGADTVFTYGGGGALVPISGDWDGDGDDTPGLYDPTTGAFFLKNANGSGSADAVFTFGAGGSGVVPLAGDWDGDGVDTIGLYVVATGTFFLKNANVSGPADVVFTFGGGGAGVAPMTGDWNGDGVDTIGLYVVATGTFFLKNANASGNADLAFTYGPAGQRPLAGDWNGDGVDTVGVYVAGTGSWFLRNTNTPGVADVTFSYGPANVTPLVGNWDGR